VPASSAPSGRTFELGVQQLLPRGDRALDQVGPDAEGVGVVGGGDLMDAAMVVEATGDYTYPDKGNMTKAEIDRTMKVLVGAGDALRAHLGDGGRPHRLDHRLARGHQVHGFVEASWTPRWWWRPPATTPIPTRAT
jgi:hypothetical protein